MPNNNVETTGDTPNFKNYKEKQRYYDEKYKNRGETIWVSVKYDSQGRRIKQPQTYNTNDGPRFFMNSAKKQIKDKK